MPNLTPRQEAIEYVGRKLRAGWTVGDATAGDFLPHIDSPLGHITRYIDHLYENGTARQRRAFINAAKRAAND